VASVLVAVAITGVLGGIRALGVAQAKAQDSDLVQRLAAEKINDMRILADPTSNGTSGDFSDRNYPDVTWTADVESTSVTNVDEITVTATRGKVSQSLMTLMYIAPATSTSTTGSSSSTSGTGGASGGARGGG
jgi:Tfp pilus assembly protein PilV